MDSAGAVFKTAAAGAAFVGIGWCLAKMHEKQRHCKVAKDSADRIEELLQIAHALEDTVQPIINEVQAGTLKLPEAMDKWMADAVPGLARKVCKGPTLVMRNEHEWVLFRRLWYSTLRLVQQPIAPLGKVKYVDFNTGAWTVQAELPQQPAGSKRFVVVSDTHMRHRDLTLPPSDILVHCGDVLMSGGDLTPASGTPWPDCVREFSRWLEENRERCPEAIVIGGNHDQFFIDIGPEALRQQLPPHAVYLCDREVTLSGGVRVYGTGYSGKLSPTPNSAFQYTSKEEQWRTLDAIPANVDVLITHSPPRVEGASFGYKPPPFDPTRTGFGCEDLREVVEKRVKPRVHLFGHIHEAHGAMRADGILYIAASNVGSHFVTAAHPPIVFDLPL